MMSTNPTQLDYKHLTPNTIPSIRDYLHLKTDLPEEADVAIVFGTKYEDPAHVVINQNLLERVQYVALTGGVNKQTHVRESLEYLRILTEKGVPEQRILLECQSTNTKENVQFLLPILQSHLNQIESVIVVSSWFHARRAIMTLKAHMPNAKYYSVGYYPEDIYPENFHQDEQKSSYILHEINVIPKYLQKNDIADITWEGGYYA